MTDIMAKDVWIAQFARSLLLREPEWLRPAALAAGASTWPSAFLLHPPDVVDHFLSWRMFQRSSPTPLR